MPMNHRILRHRIAGGWSPDFGSVAEVDASGMVDVPWLASAENIHYTLDGGVRKVGGTEKLNAAALEAGAKVMGLYDYWRFSGLSATQKRVIHVGTKIKKDDADGVFSDILTGMSAGAVPSYATFDNYLVIMSTGDVPRFWDQTTAKVLGTNTPNGSFGITHANRFWLAGDPSAPSRLYYSQALPAGADGDWQGTGAGLIDIDPGDGDRITALASYKKELWVFKGPNHGSIHRVSGSSPGTFGREIFVRGLGAVCHNSVFEYMDDIGFLWADGSIHSLKSTAAFGDFHEAALSLPLNEYLRDHLRHDRLPFASAVNIASLGEVVFTLSFDTSSANNGLLVMDYRFISSENSPRWSFRPAIKVAFVANVVDQTINSRPALFAGGNDGFVRKLNRSIRTIDGTIGYNAKVTLPFLHYGSPETKKTLGNLAVGLIPRGAATLTLRWRRDAEADQFTTLQQSAGSDVLAPATPPLTPFTLDVSRLGGAAYTHIFANVEEGGEFRQIQFELEQGGNFEDMDVHTLLAEIEPGAISWENP